MDTLADRLLARANEIYAEKKRERHPARWPHALPQNIESDQVKAVLEACAEEIEQLREEMDRYYERKHYDEY